MASPKPKLPKAASTSNMLSRPGAATKRPVPAKLRRSLQRVLTDERENRSVSNGPGGPISLMRSATAPVLPGLKREASEAPSLGSIPFADSKLVQANRGGVLSSKQFSRREVDMSSLAPKVGVKRMSQVNIEAELKEAISALKKPNRELAGKVLAEIAEKRSASAPHARSMLGQNFARDNTNRRQNLRSQFTTHSFKACRSPPLLKLIDRRIFLQRRNGTVFLKLQKMPTQAPFRHRVYQEFRSLLLGRLVRSRQNTRCSLSSPHQLGNLHLVWLKAEKRFST